MKTAGVNINADVLSFSVEKHATRWRPQCLASRESPPTITKPLNIFAPRGFFYIVGLLRLIRSALASLPSGAEPLIILTGSFSLAGYIYNPHPNPLPAGEGDYGGDSRLARNQQVTSHASPVGSATTKTGKRNASSFVPQKKKSLLSFSSCKAKSAYKSCLAELALRRLLISLGLLPASPKGSATTQNHLFSNLAPCSRLAHDLFFGVRI